MASLRILQFGTSRFLQAHVDLFAHQANVAGRAQIEITVVKGSPDPARTHRVAALAAPGGYPVRLRGIEAGQVLDETIRVTSVTGALALPGDWEALCRAFVQRTDLVVSNTGDAGYIEAQGDCAALADPNGCPQGFPARLAALLHRRWRETGRGLAIFPCELVSANGDVLRAVLDDLAARAGLPRAFRDWMRAEVRFANSLVDRIVSEPIEPAGAVAEPYALWAIEGDRPEDAPFRHSAIMVVPALEPLERLKLHVLNLSHTVLADRWLAGADAGLVVRRALEDPDWREMLMHILETEVLPGFAAMGMADEAARYMAVTLERFANPFLEHRLADIAQNHAVKVERRIVGFLAWTAPANLDMPLLRAICDRRHCEPNPGQGVAP